MDRVFHQGSRIHLSWAVLMTAPVRRALHEIFNPYRPERHYMRGPGPKWHAKHDGPLSAH
jgi:hypothetical protein